MGNRFPALEGSKVVCVQLTLSFLPYYNFLNWDIKQSGFLCYEAYVTITQITRWYYFIFKHIKLCYATLKKEIVSSTSLPCTSSPSTSSVVEMFGVNILVLVKAMHEIFLSGYSTLTSVILSPFVLHVQLAGEQLNTLSSCEYIVASKVTYVGAAIATHCKVTFSFSFVAVGEDWYAVLSLCGASMHEKKTLTSLFSTEHALPWVNFAIVLKHM